ncbi:unnamed protein product [Urochloa humidicola]
MRLGKGGRGSTGADPAEETCGGKRKGWCARGWADTAARARLPAVGRWWRVGSLLLAARGWAGAAAVARGRCAAGGGAVVARWLMPASGRADVLFFFHESTSVVRKAEGEYHGHQSLLMCTRGLLSTVQWQDVLDSVILTIGFIIFSLAVLYVVSRRIGLLTLQRKLADAIRSEMC